MKKISLFLSYLFLITLTLMMIIPLSTKVKAEGVWNYSSFIEGTESGEIVHHAQGDAGSVKNVTYSETVGNFNNVSFKVRPNATWNYEVEAHFSFYITTPSGIIGFKFMNYWKAVRVESMDNSYNVNSFIHDAVNYDNNQGGNWNVNTAKWYDISISFNNSFFKVIVDNNEILEAKNQTEQSFENSNISIGIWGCNPSIKDLELNKEEVVVEKNWFSTDFKETIEDESVVYTSFGELNQGAKNLFYRDNSKDYNVFTFKFRPNEEFGGFDTSHTTFYFTLSENKYLGFRLMNYWKASRIVLLEGDSIVTVAEDKYVDKYTFVEGWNEYDKWYDVRIYVSPHFIIMTVDGYITSCIHYEHGYDLSNKSVFIGTWGMNPSIKDIAFYKNDINTYNLRYLDLDFRSEESTTALEVTNGTINYIPGEIEYNINSSNSSLIINNSQRGFGSYSAKVDVRNSVMLRLKNESNASKLKLSFNTTANNETFQKELDIEPNSGYKTYFLNYSDLGMIGYLTKLTISPQNVDTGKLILDSISFEREDPLYDYVAEYINATASKTDSTVRITGKVKDEYKNKNIHIALSPVTNYTESTFNIGANDLIVSTTDENGYFDITIPLYDKNNMSLLSQLFMACIEGDGNYIKLSKPFSIENYTDFIDNPYAFTLPNLTVNITDSPYNAIGDAYTDDTDSIQNAIDYVASMGGGTVVVPGDTSTDFGRRYIITHIELKSNVELRIEKGATLWQSPRASDYKYDVLYGHDYPSTSMWPHSCNINEPLILIRQKENVRITGGGTIRMMDAGDEATYPRSLIDPNHGANCANIIHLAPIFIVDSHNLEVSDITILHTNNWHLTTLYSSRMFFANNYFKDPSCKNSDGFGLACAKDTVVARNFMFSNDDSYTINACPTDPRRIAWWSIIDEKEDAIVENIELEYNNLYGGLGLCFIPWGMHIDNLEKTIIRNIVAHDNIFQGEQDLGSWPDDPFYGESQSFTYTFKENDYSAIQDVYLYNNVYSNNRVALTCGDLGTGNIASASNFIIDNPDICTREFLNSSFERDIYYDTESDYQIGLSYWTTISSGGSTSTIIRSTKTKTTLVDKNEVIVKDYAALICGNATLFQGLYLTKGVYTFTSYLKTSGGMSKIIVAKSLIKEHIYDDTRISITNQKELVCDDDYTLVSITFEVLDDGVYALGFMHTGEGSLSFDDSSISINTELEPIIETIKVKLNEASQIDDSLYTDESVNSFINAINGLVDALNSDDLIKENCLSAIENYNNAYAGLKIKEVDPIITTIPVITTSPIITTAPNITTNPIITIGPEITTTSPTITTNNPTDVINTTAIPQTTANNNQAKKGCKSSISLFPFTFMVLGFIAVVFKKKKEL